MILPSNDEPVTVVTVLPIAPTFRAIIEALCGQRADMLALGLGVQAAQLERVLRAVTGLRIALAKGGPS